MTPDHSTPDAAPGTGETAEEHYVGLRLGDGTVIVYERETNTGWIQSDVATPLPSAR